MKYLSKIVCIILLLLSGCSRYEESFDGIDREMICSGIDYSKRSVIHDNRVHLISPKYIILHSTATENVDLCIKYLTGKKDDHKVSCHFLVDQKGNAWNFVSAYKIAWHAGISYFNDDEKLNNLSIGIEQVGLNNIDEQQLLEYNTEKQRYIKENTIKLEDRYWVLYTYPQIKRVSEIVRILVDRYDIKPWNIISHGDIAYGRKMDVGLYPWKYIYERFDIGFWPWTNFDAPLFLNDDIVISILVIYGYRRPENDTQKKSLLRVFQLHFCGSDYFDGYLKNKGVIKNIPSFGMIDSMTRNMVYNLSISRARLDKDFRDKFLNIFKDKKDELAKIENDIQVASKNIPNNLIKYSNIQIAS